MFLYIASNSFYFLFFNYYYYYTLDYVMSYKYIELKNLRN